MHSLRLRRNAIAETGNGRIWNDDRNKCLIRALLGDTAASFLMPEMHL
jgi:hypothetical protein